MRSKRVPQIFINYRHADTSESAIRLHDTLARRFGALHIFWDERGIEGGDIFDQSIKDALNSTNVLLALIGKEWSTITLEGKRRLDDVDDYVCLEIASVLDDDDVRVIPVLVEGATLPRKNELPARIEKLLDHRALTVSSQNWEKDALRLVNSIEKGFKRSSPYSLLLGVIAGFFAGTIFGIVYTLQQTDIPLWRSLVGGGLGLMCGLILSGSINLGIDQCSRLLRWSSLANPIGGTLGGVVGGVVASFFCAAATISVEKGDAVNPLGVAAAVAAASVFIAAGVLFPEWRREWYKRLITLLAVVVGTLSAAVLVWWLFHDRAGDIQEMFNVDTPLSNGVLIIGLICGGMSGLQVGLTLWAYDHLPTAEDLKL